MTPRPTRSGYLTPTQYSKQGTWYSMSQTTSNALQYTQQTRTNYHHYGLMKSPSAQQSKTPLHPPSNGWMMKSSLCDQHPNMNDEKKPKKKQNQRRRRKQGRESVRETRSGKRTHDTCTQKLYKRPLAWPYKLVIQEGKMTTHIIHRVCSTHPQTHRSGQCWIPFVVLVMTN